MNTFVFNPKYNSVQFKVDANFEVDLIWIMWLKLLQVYKYYILEIFRKLKSRYFSQSVSLSQLGESNDLDFGSCFVPFNFLFRCVSKQFEVHLTSFIFRFQFFCFFLKFQVVPLWRHRAGGETRDWYIVLKKSRFEKVPKVNRVISYQIAAYF